MKKILLWLSAACILPFLADASLAVGADDVPLISKAAERGSAASQVLLASAYLKGDGGLAKDPVRAAHWFEQAALQGNGYAEERLGDLYEQGRGVPQNLRLAFDWRLKAADRGMVQAQLKVGRMYQDGAGTAKDAAQALRWYRRAAAEGNAEAQYLLGRMYREGDGVAADRATAMSWFEKAARQGYESAIDVLQTIESLGYQVEEGWHQRLPELRKLADDGDVEAQYQLAQRYEHGAGGMKRDAAAALDWYKRAAAGGNRMAMQALGQIYAEGLDGVARDPASAKEWADKAAAATR